MTTLTDIGAIQEAESGIGLSETIARIAGAGNTKGLYWDVMMGRTLVPSYISRLTARGRFLSEFSTYAPSLFLPLTHTAVPTIAASGTTGTFTRATASTWKNNDGYLVTGVAGEIGFVGARRVRNLCQKPEDFTAWSATGGGTRTIGVTDPNGGTTAATFTSASANEEFYWAQSSLVSIGDKVLSSCYIRRRTGTGPIAIFNSSGGTATTVPVDGTWQRFSAAVGTATNTTALIDIRISTIGDAVDIWHPQIENVTAQTTQTAGEYVSVGVASAPYYHGSFVDGVKCFATDINGSPIPSTTLLGDSAEGTRTNLCLQSNAFGTAPWIAVSAITIAQNTVSPDGAISAWTLTDSNALATSLVSQTNITLTAAPYTFSCFIKKTSGATTFPVLEAFDGVSKIANATIDTDNGVATAWTAYNALTNVTTSASCVSYNSVYWRVSMTFTATAAVWTVYLIPSGTKTATQSTGILDVTAQGSAVFYGAQVELGSFASSLINTTTIAVAKNSDVESVSTSNNIAAAAGSVYLEYTPTHTPSGTIALWGTYVDASNYTAILHDATNLIFRKRIAGVNYDATIATAFVSGTTYKACATWGTAGTSITLNGTEGTSHANTTAAQIAATMQWGADGNSLQQPFASIRNCRDWLRQLSASERAAVTA